MKIFCVGRNYTEHAKELNNAIPEAPVIFMKPATALLRGRDFYYPEFSKDIHYECELVYRVCKNGKYIDEKFASKYVDAIALGIDFTARDIQSEQKKKGLPWEIAKAFDNSAVVSEFMPMNEMEDVASINFTMKKNDQVVQQGNASEMIFSIEKIISYLSVYFSLQQGDLIFTGTPSGVGPIAIGDKLEGFIENEKKFEIKVK